MTGRERRGERGEFGKVATNPDEVARLAGRKVKHAIGVVKHGGVPQLRVQATIGHFGQQHRELVLGLPMGAAVGEQAFVQGVGFFASHEADVSR